MALLCFCVLAMEMEILPVAAASGMISRLQSPDLLLHLWTWAALALAVVATFSSLIRRSKRVILRLRRVKSLISPLPSAKDSPNDDDDSCASSSSDDDESDGEEMLTVSEEDPGDLEEAEGQNGDYTAGGHHAWPELARDGSVVKLWDGLGLGFHRRSRSISILDLERDEILRSLRWDSDGIPAVHVADRGAVVSAGAGGANVWDPRAAGPVGATWRWDGTREVLGILGRDVNNYGFYLGAGDYDEGKLLTVVDLRNIRTPLEEQYLSTATGRLTQL